MKGLFGPLLPDSKPCRGTKESSRADIENLADESDHNTSAHFPARGDSPGTKRSHPWTRVHSHFALMGGFAFDTSKLPTNILPDGRTRLTLTPNALRKLATNEPQLLPDLSVETIRDKSKSNSFAKFLVCMQACWFIAQITGRLACSSPISLLEMNTYLHALCCLVIYVAWWDKPHDIEEPYLMATSTDLARKVCAWMVMESKIGATKTKAPPVFRSLRSAMYLVHDEDFSNVKAFSNLMVHKYQMKRVEHINDEEVDQQHGLRLYLGQRICGYRLTPHFASQFTNECDAFIELNIGDIDRLRLANSLWDESLPSKTWNFERLPWVHGNPGMLTTRISITSSLDGNLSNFVGSTWFTRKFSDSSLIFLMSMMFAGSLYGLIHLLAWNGPFTTVTERWLWRVSCFIIASPVILFPLLGVVLDAFDALRESRLGRWLVAPQRVYGALLGLFHDLCVILLVSSSILAGLIYTGARVYLLVECSINLAHLPLAVYKQPEWSQYIPHFGAG